MDDGSPNANFTLGQETFQKWINEIKVKTQPSIIPEIEIIDYKETKVVRLAIPEFPIKPVSFKGRYFKRVKNSNHLLTTLEIADLKPAIITSVMGFLFSAQFRVRSH